MNLGNGSWFDFHRWKRFIRLQDRLAASGQLGKQLVQVDAILVWSVRSQVSDATVIEFPRAMNVAVAKMMQANGHLDQPLVKLSHGSLVIFPEIFPGFVRFKEISRVEVADSSEKTRVVKIVAQRQHPLRLVATGE